MAGQYKRLTPVGDYFCGECKQPCDWQDVDYGIGAYEFWGAPSVHVNIQRVSTCCEGDLFEDDELECPAHFCVD